MSKCKRSKKNLNNWNDVFFCWSIGFTFICFPVRKFLFCRHHCRRRRHYVRAMFEVVFRANKISLFRFQWAYRTSRIIFSLCVLRSIPLSRWLSSKFFELVIQITAPFCFSFWTVVEMIMMDLMLLYCVVKPLFSLSICILWMNFLSAFNCHAIVFSYVYVFYPIFLKWVNENVRVPREKKPQMKEAKAVACI